MMKQLISSNVDYIIFIIKKYIIIYNNYRKHVKEIINNLDL